MINLLYTETHTYDGKLGNRKREIQKKLDAAKLIAQEEKINDLSVLEVFLKDSGASAQALSYFQRIADIQDENNYDPTNDLSATDLLWICSSVSDEERKNMAEILIVQLEDMSLGFCPQGRSTRLAQVVFSLED